MKQLWVIALLATACSLGTGSFAGKSCKSNVDCPDPYVCAQVRSEGFTASGAPAPLIRTCELVRGVETFDPTADNPADYCHDVKPILDKHCVSNCHGVQRDYPGTAGLAFRLDVYSTGTVLPGAGAKVANIKNRIDLDTMPPVGLMGYTRASAMEKGIIARWANSGGPECFGDAGTRADGGTADAGRADGGDGG